MKPRRDGADSILKAMQSIRDMKFKTKLTLLVTTATVGLLVIGVAAFVTLGKMKGGGAMTADLLNESRISLLAISAVTTGLVCSLGVIIARSILGPLDQTMRVLQSLAAGDLRSAVNVSSKDEFGEMGIALNQAIESMAEIVRSIAATAEHVASASEEISSSADEQSQSAETQKDQTSQVAIALQEMGSTVS